MTGERGRVPVPHDSAGAPHIPLHDPLDVPPGVLLLVKGVPSLTSSLSLRASMAASRGLSSLPGFLVSTVREGGSLWSILLQSEQSQVFPGSHPLTTLVTLRLCCPACPSSVPEWGPSQGSRALRWSFLSSPIWSRLCPSAPQDGPVPASSAFLGCLMVQGESWSLFASLLFLPCCSARACPLSVFALATSSLTVLTGLL